MYGIALLFLGVLFRGFIGADAVDLLPQGRTTPELAPWRTLRVALGDGFNFMFRVDTPVGQVPAILAQLDAVVRDLNK